MGKFFAVSIFVGCIFFAGMFFGATMTEKQETNEIESISSSYKDWKKEKAQAETSVQDTNEKNDRENIYSNIAKSISDKLKTVARSIVFQVISIFEKVFGI